MTPSRDISRLIEIMAALRTPGTGCPWDVEQTFSTIAPYTIEEAYEVADAIDRGDLDDLCDELGDLLLQVVFHARMAEEQNAFAFGDVVAAVTKKLIRRHPHVFGDAKARAAGDVKGLWERIKAEEKAERAARRPGCSARPDRRPRRYSGCPPRAGARPETAGQGEQSRLRLERSDGGACQDPRGNRRSRGGVGGGQNAGRRRPKRAIFCSRWSISCAISMEMPRRRCATPIRNSNAASHQLRTHSRRNSESRPMLRWRKWTRCGMPPNGRRQMLARFAGNYVVSRG